MLKFVNQFSLLTDCVRSDDLNLVGYLPRTFPTDPDLWVHIFDNIVSDSLCLLGQVVIAMLTEANYHLHIVGYQCVIELLNVIVRANVSYDMPVRTAFNFRLFIQTRLYKISRAVRHHGFPNTIALCPFTLLKIFNNPIFIWNVSVLKVLYFRWNLLRCIVKKLKTGV